MITKRRALVLVDEAARHPFRQSLPPHVCRGFEARPGWRTRMALTGSDWRGFLTAYCATFVAVSVFIA
ncbi:hypothetical protein [Novosphingobium album (ex Liu et al. 2023)]|uniref:Uncharacterized protein n=1 Tax=Novosphingobium album (ex Liu et al. 2023) TaxID=3031130 RepID=A0ABT5WPR9_9SPHN|nr:hypothetical protein [Novosphingobium album (ex Liu et al. 2023)]MDE8652044.1 hypothetical protein [Novosphingobium album (ex Liu et al. 2023)]